MSSTTISGGLSCGDALAEAGLIKVQPGGTTIGGTLGPPITLGALYYNPQNGQYVQVGNSIYLDGNGVNNLIRAGDGDDLDTFFSDDVAASDDVYNLASAGAIAASALEPGTVTIRIIVNGDNNFSEVTDDGAGNFVSGAVLPSGGTVNYANRTLTGTTAGLTIGSRVEITFALANTAGEQLTVRAGNGIGTGDGGSLSMAAGIGAANGNLLLQTGAQGSTNVVDRYAISGSSVSLTNTTATSLFSVTVANNTMVGGSATITVRATDGSDYQATTVTLNYAAINDAGTVTSQVIINGSNTATIASTGTLTVTASTVDGAGIVTIQITATSSLTPTTLDATYQVLNNSGQAITLFD